MRTVNSIKNIYIGLITQIVVILLAFVSRKVFIDTLGTEYLGINGILTNILSMLSLVEGGIGVSIVYNLYEPLANNDTKKVAGLIKLYKKIYSIIATLVVILSIILYPVLHIFIKSDDIIPNMEIVYFIFVLKTVISYVNAHKWSLINADQKEYVLARYNILFNILTTILKIIILKNSRNYILYLIIEVVMFIIQNIYNGIIVNKRYPYIKSMDKYTIDNDIKANLVLNFKATFLHSIGKYCVLSTDNLLISAFIGTKSVGIYSNYSMVINQLTALISPILNGIGASVGNLIATEGKEKKYEIFKVIYLINFWIYSISFIFLYNLLEPFLAWWIGDGFLLNRFTLIFILINFYITGLRSSIYIFKSKAGIFDNDKYIPLIESVINLGSSVILIKYFGIAGVFMGTTISTICLPLWIQSKLVYNKVFEKSVLEYFKVYIFYAILTLVVCLLTNFICKVTVDNNGFYGLISKGIISLFIPNLIFILIFSRSNEFRYLLKTIDQIINKKKNKIKA